MIFAALFAFYYNLLPVFRRGATADISAAFQRRVRAGNDSRRVVTPEFFSD